MTASTQRNTKSPETGLMRGIVRIALPLLVLATGVILAVGLIETSPKARRTPPPRQARLVEIQPVKFSKQRTVIHGMGTVQPSREVALNPRVSGQIVTVADEFMPGGHFREGEMLVQIDPTDFGLALRQRESEVAQAQSDMTLEFGQQTIAKREYEMLGETIKEEDRALVLRQPQLEKMRARLTLAQAALEQAKLDLKRTTVRAPFNAMVRLRDVNVGVHVTTATTLATLIGMDTYWIEVTVPVDQLNWLQIPKSSTDTGSPVRVFNEAAWGSEAYRTGHIVRLLSDLETEGRMAKLLVAVQDPHSLQPANSGRPKLLLGDYLRVEIEGIELSSVAAVDRQLVRDSNRVWVMNEKDQLEIRPVEIAFRGRDHLLVTNGLREGDRLVTTDLSAPVEGMPLRTQSDLPPAALDQENR